MLCYWSCDETQLFWFCLNHWDLENHMNKLQPNNSENWINDMKSISKYCTLSFASRNSLTNFQQLSSQQCRVSFCSEGNRSCSLPGKNGGAFGTWSSGSLALNWPWEVGGHRLPTGTETFAVGTSQSAGSDDPEAGQGLNAGFDCAAALYLGEGQRSCADPRWSEPQCSPPSHCSAPTPAWQGWGRAGTSASHFSRAAETFWWAQWYTDTRGMVCKTRWQLLVRSRQNWRSGPTSGYLLWASSSSW